MSLLMRLAAVTAALSLSACNVSTENRMENAAEAAAVIAPILDSPDATILGQLPRVTVLQKPFQMPELAAAVREVLP